MNKWVGMGRLTKDPEVRYGQDGKTAVAKYTLACDRRFKRDGEPSADFIPCTAFGRAAEFSEKYLRKGIRIVVSGRIQTGSYKKSDGTTVWTTDIIVEEQEFAESKSASQNNNQSHSGGFLNGAETSSDGFINIPDEIDVELPFH